MGKLFARRAALKKFEAEGRTDWKNKVRKVITTADVIFSTQNQVKSKKRLPRPQISYTPRYISKEQD